MTRPFRDTLGIEEPVIERIQESFDEQLHVIIEERVPVFSFTFGIPTQAQMEKLKEQHIITSGTATTVQEAIQLEAAGVDTIVAQGSEAGGTGERLNHTRTCRWLERWHSSRKSSITSTSL
ncbi:enoyl-[acyl-carrier-protein] reductase [Geomicrobium sp. JCM 19037]|nr:enoyl-[acyl-carrier-protein] reductase [Geomicrobium sp. JCM 19037]